MTYRRWLQAARGAVDGNRALDAVRQITRHHRIQSSPGYDDASTWVEGELRALGLEVVVEQVSGDGRTRCFGQLMPEGWHCESAQAWLRSGDAREPLCDFESQPLSIVQRSGPVHGTFPLVAVEDGSEPEHYDGIDVRGAVVLTGTAPHRALDLAVRDRGAAGLLSDFRRLFPPVRSLEDDRDSLAYTSFWWSADAPRSFGFVVSPNRGAEIRRRLQSGEKLAIEAVIRSAHGPRPIPLLSARLPGDRDEEVLVLSHLCHPRPSANDNASGAAALLETARALATLQRDPGLARRRRGIRLLWMPELTGTFAWLDRDPGRIDRLVAGLNLDMVGEDQAQCGSTLLVEHPPYFMASFAEELLVRIRAEATDWITSYSGPGHVPLTRMAEVPYSGGSDHVVLVDPTIGVPCPMLIQWPDRYYHSSFDTPDRCDPASLALAARIAVTYAGTIATLDDDGTEALLDIVARGARRRLLTAIDLEHAGRAIERERQRGRRAIESMARLGTSRARIVDEVTAWDAFAHREAGAAPMPATSDRGAGGSRRVPRRVKRGPLDFLDHLNERYERLDDSDRALWRSLRRRAADPRLELAWFACDGVRSVEEITRLVNLEVGSTDGADLDAWFDLLDRLGACAWTPAEARA